MPYMQQGWNKAALPCSTAQVSSGLCQWPPKRCPWPLVQAGRAAIPARTRASSGCWHLQAQRHPVLEDSALLHLPTCLVCSVHRAGLFCPHAKLCALERVARGH